MAPSRSAWGGTPMPPNVQQRLSEDQRNFLIAALIRVPALFALGRAAIKPDIFDTVTEAHYAILWRAALTLADKNGGQLPNLDEQAHALLELEASSIALAAPSNIVGAGGIDVLFTTDDGPGLIDWIYEQKLIVFQETYCKDLLKRFLDERVAFDPYKKFVDQLGQNVVPTNMDRLLTEIKTARDKISTLDISPIAEVEIDDWSSNSLTQLPSNVSFIDAATDGGPALGEVLVLLGPSGGGKSLLGIQLSVEGARYQVRQAENGCKAGYWYFYSYESPIKPDIRQRVVSNAAKIEWSSIMKASSRDQLSTTGDLKDYEMIRWREKIEAGINIPGERERYKAAMEELGERLKLVDMSGALAPSIGAGGIDEIVRYLNQEQVKGHQPVGIVIDYAGIAVARMMATKNEKIDNEFAHLNNFVNNIRVEIASRFNCVVWVLHQLHGDAAAASSTTRQHHSKARGARNFADNANFAFNIGTTDPSNNCCVITCTKHRRANVVKDPIVYVDGALNRMESADNKYALDPAQRKIIDKTTLNKVVDTSLFLGAVSHPLLPANKPKINPLSGAGDLGTF
jgi:hypothetical protein